MTLKKEKIAKKKREKNIQRQADLGRRKGEIQRKKLRKNSISFSGTQKVLLKQKKETGENKKKLRWEGTWGPKGWGET